MNNLSDKQGRAMRGDQKSTVKNRLPYTTAEIKILNEFYPKEGPRLLRQRLPRRSISSIKTMASKSGLKFNGCRESNKNRLCALNDQLADYIEFNDLPHAVHERLVEASNIIYACEAEIYGEQI